MPLTLVDAARLARSLHEDHTDLRPKIGDDRFRVHVGHLRDLTEKKIGRPISVRIANDPGCMNGMVLDLADKAVILVSQRHSENPCWIRMTVTKELVHLYSGHMLDGGGSLNMDLVAARDCRIDIPSIHDDMHIEKFCFYAALEILLPYEWRGAFSDAFRVEKLTPYLLACNCRIPQTLVTYFFDRGFAEKSLEANQAI